MTKLPRFSQQAKGDLDQRLRGDTKKARFKQNEYADKRWRAKEKKVKEGDEVPLKREKCTTKPPWDPKPFEVVQVEVRAKKNDFQSVASFNAH